MSVLATERLSLRPVTPADLAPMHALWTAEFVRRYLFDDRVVAASEARQLFEASERTFAASG